MEKTVNLARGKWRGILITLGIPAEILVNRHGPCPLCRDGKDRFRFDDKEGRGTFICNRCGAGDGATLAMKVTGLTFADVMKRIDAILGSSPLKSDSVTRQTTDGTETSNFMGLWSLGKPVTTQDTAGRYLNSRGLILPNGGNLRFISNGYDGEGGVHPMMAALVADPDGRPVQLHRTFLRPDGQGKALMTAPRRFMKGEVPSGSAVRLYRYESGPLGIAEGIETAIAASMLNDMPVWSALDAGKLAKWQPPAQCRSVVIFADNDAHGKGMDCAEALRGRLTNAGLQVTIRAPERVGEDWNDVLFRRLGAARRTREGAEQDHGKKAQQD